MSSADLQSPDTAGKATYENPLRIGTFNVHGPVIGQRLDKVARLLLTNRLTLVCIQEVDPRSLQELEKKLTAFSGSKWSSRFGGHGNGIVTSCEIIWHGRVQMRSAATREARGALRCVVKHCVSMVSARCAATPDCCRTFACVATHLDWRKEETRLEQLRALLDDPWEEQSILNGYLLAGDLNALTKSDYSDKDWQRIIADRESAGFFLQGPRGDVLDFLKERGFTDSGRECQLRERAGKLWTTSRFRTRIDYILSSKGFKGSFSSYNVVDAQSKKLSDHNLVYVDVQLPL